MNEFATIYALFSFFKGPVLCMSRLEETVNDADYIFECVIEDLSIKNELMESMLLLMFIFFLFFYNMIKGDVQ